MFNQTTARWADQQAKTDPPLLKMQIALSMLHRLGLLALAVAVVAGCVTTGYSNPQFPSLAVEEKTIAVEARNSDLRVLLILSQAFVAVRIDNLTDSPIALNWDKSSYRNSDRRAFRLVHTGVRYGDIAREQVPTMIPATSYIEDVVVASDAVGWDSSRTRYEVKNWIDESPDGALFLIAYDKETESGFLEVEVAVAPSALEPEALPVVGYVTATERFLHLLFLGLPEQSRRTLRELALEKARRLHGPDVELGAARFSSAWHPTSMLIMMSVYGWVEEATIEAEVLGQPPSL